MSSIVGWNSYPGLRHQSSMRLPTLPLPMTTYRTPYPNIHNFDSTLRKHSTRGWSHELALTCSAESVQPSEITPGSYLGS
ncbi:hypothetical protein RSAG8_13496, partial [Rhizoctonia solani AG-8 WAC10335]